MHFDFPRPLCGKSNRVNDLVAPSCISGGLSWQAMRRAQGSGTLHCPRRSILQISSRCKLVGAPGLISRPESCKHTCPNDCCSCCTRRASFSTARTEAPAWSSCCVRLPLPGPISSTLLPGCSLAAAAMDCRRAASAKKFCPSDLHAASTLSIQHTMTQP